MDRENGYQPRVIGPSILKKTSRFQRSASGSTAASTLHTTVCLSHAIDSRHTHNISTGHAGAMLQARQLGDELLVGVHSDKAILDNKGPTVMRLDERCVYLSPMAWK